MYLDTQFVAWGGLESLGLQGPTPECAWLGIFMSIPPGSIIALAIYKYFRLLIIWDVKSDFASLVLVFS